MSTTTRKPATATADSILRDLRNQHTDLQVRLVAIRRHLNGEFGPLTHDKRAFYTGKADALKTVIQQLDGIIESATR